jgi:UDP-glucose 4-epimerase
MNNSINTVIITGGAGYIGSRLANHLMHRGYRVVVIDNLSGSSKYNLDPRVIFYQKDIRDPQITEIFQKEKAFGLFHMAASKSARLSMEHPKEFEDVNVVGSHNVFVAATYAGIKRIIFTSTAGIYGDAINNIKQKETDQTHPSSLYAETKRITENELLTLARQGVEGIIMRFANVYGPGGTSDTKGVVEIFTRQIRENKPILIHGDGNQTRDFIYTDDLIDVCMLLLTCEYSIIKSSPIFNVSTGIAVSILDVLQSISRALGKSPSILYDAHAYIGQKESVLDPERALSILGWRARTPLDVGIKNTIASLKI